MLITNSPSKSVCLITNSPSKSVCLITNSPSKSVCLITNSPSKSVCLSIAWVLVMFYLVRETRDCCANQQCNVSMEKLRFLKTFQLIAWLQIYM